MRVVHFKPYFLDLETTGLNPLENRIVAIGLTAFEKDVNVLLCRDENEELSNLHLLNEKFQNVSAQIPRTMPLLVGYNIGFDLGFIASRLAVLVKKFDESRSLLRFAGLLRELPRVDLMHIISRYWLNNSRFVKMKQVCQALGIDYDDCDGSDIPELVTGGNWDAIINHLVADLERTKELYAILRDQGLITHNLKVRYNLMDAEVIVE